MRIRAPSTYVLLGTSLALMLQTNLRFVGPLGPGELLAAVFVGLKLVHKGTTLRVATFYRPDTLTLQFIAIVFLIVTPMTFLSDAFQVSGTSIRDLASYYFVCAVLLVLPRYERDVRGLIYAFLFVTFSTIIAQYMVGGGNAYYFARFTGGAKNPNQLGTYLLVALALSAYLQQIWMRLSSSNGPTRFAIG